MRTGRESSRQADPADRAGALADAPIRILCVADPGLLAVVIRSLLEKSLRVDFEFEVEPVLDRAALRIHHERFDVLLLDLAHAATRRAELMDRASDFATRLPVVALSGTEALASNAAIGRGPALGEALEEADLPALLQRTLRRARRLGTFALAPVFCRLERFDA